MKKVLPDEVFFIGGFSGARKKDGKPFYALNFMVEVEAGQNRDGSFGNDTVTCFVDKSDFEAFEKADVAGTMISAVVSKGQYGQGTLVSYDI